MYEAAVLPNGDQSVSNNNVHVRVQLSACVNKCKCKAMARKVIVDFRANGGLHSYPD